MLTRLAILIQSCEKYRDDGTQAFSANTWLKEWPGVIEHHYLLGSEAPQKAPDEIVVGAPDAYHGCPWKEHAAAKWALANDVTHLFFCDVDTYVCVPRLLMSGFQQWDYSGFRCCELHASGGAGHWLSRAACGVLANAAPTAAYSDFWAGHHLLRAGIQCHHDQRYAGDLNCFDPATSITCHLGKADRMPDTHRRVMEAMI